MDVGLLLVESFTNVLLVSFLLLINVTSASASVSSSEAELYLSSVNSGADNCDCCEPDVDDAGRGIRVVKGLCGPGGNMGAGVPVLLTDLAFGDWGIWIEVC